MFVYKDILNELLDSNNKVNYSELIIITGYITPSYIDKIYAAFDGDISIYLGMGDTKYKTSTYTSIKTVLNGKQSRLKFYYTDFDVHAKLYCWKSTNGSEKVLIGSANFSDSMTNPYKEILGDNNSPQIKGYIDYIKNNSTLFASVPQNKIKKTNPKLSSKPHTTPILLGNDGALLSLLSSRRGSGNICGKLTRANEVHAASGLNWGLSSSVNKLNDGCIPITSDLIKNTTSMLRIPKASKRVFKAIWDDGTKMDIQFEGNYVLNGVKYPKQIASYPSKEEMGRYLRNRIGNKIGKSLIIPNTFDKKKLNKTQKKALSKYMITSKDLGLYGRFDVEIRDMGDGTYYLDFSV